MTDRKRDMTIDENIVYCGLTSSGKSMPFEQSAAI